jgi:hypothetical protein
LNLNFETMYTMRKWILSGCLLCCTLYMYAGVESISYDILLFGNKIGKMLVTHEAKPDGTDLYTLVTTSKAKFLWIDKSNDSRYELIYKAGKLVSSVFKEIENGEVKRFCNIKWDGTKYQVESHSGKHTLAETPTFSTITAYFQGFKKTDKIFYESEGNFANTEYPEPNTMEFKTSDGHKSIYHYVNDKINNMEFKISIATIYMVLSK